MSEKKTDDDLRQLDKEIAELLGYRAATPTGFKFWYLKRDGYGVDCVMPADSEDAAWREQCPHFSSTWEGFGLLVEEWERQGWNYQVSLLGRHDEFGATPAVFICSAPGYRPFWHIERTGNDIRHAAARATRDALKAAKEREQCQQEE